MRILLAVAGAAALGGSPALAQDIDKLPSILVAGHGEVETDPDRATFTYALRGEGPTSDDAVRAMVAMGKRIEAAIKSVDGDVDPRTGGVEAKAVKSPSCKEEEYGPKQLSTGSCAILGYVASQLITVETARVTESGTMIGLAGRNGAQDASSSRFSLSKGAEAQAMQAALAKAFRDAESNAAAIAAGSRLRLGAILYASNTQRIDTRSAQDIVITGSRSPLANVTSPVIVDLKPKKTITTADVTVRYAIAR